MLKIKLFILILVASTIPAFANNLPPSNYVDEGACPFEGCAYKEWTVNKKTNFYADRNPKSPTVFKADKGEVVTGLTGVVVTTRLGKAKVLKETTVGKENIPVKPGDIIYVISYSMESMKLWVNGHFIDNYVEMIPINEKNISADYAENLAVKEIREPKTEWWVKVQNEKGQIGWTLVNDNFDHMDSLE